MSESATITITSTEPAPNGHAATFTAEAPATNDNTAASSPDAKQPAQSAQPPANKFHKPVDLILANVAHNAGVAMQSFARLTGTSAAECDESFALEVARRMLCEIAHEASPRMVLFALGSVAGPASLEEVAQRLQAARDAATST